MAVWTFNSVQADDVEYLIDHANNLKLSQMRTWHRLIAYEKGLLPGSRLQSAVLNEDYFLSPSGKYDPESELRETVLAMVKPEIEGFDHAQCRFPARYLFLKSHLGERFTDFPEINCLEYKAWREEDSVESLSVIFASGYLGNPASYYGHTFLKANGSGGSRLLDSSINFGADFSREDGPVKYILSGLFGWYEGSFTDSEYYLHNQNYRELELRNLWEYQLNLEPEELDMVLAHIWELKGRSFTYYFANKNCSYRLGELLEVVEDFTVNPDNAFWIMPQSQVQQLSQMPPSGRQQISDIRFWPSRQERLSGRYFKLNDAAKVVVNESVDQRQLKRSGGYLELSLDDKYQALDTLLDYYRFLALEEGEEAVAEPYREILSERYQLPPVRSQSVSWPEESPDEGRRPSLIQVGILSNKELGSGYSLTLRPAYYDALDSAAQHVPYAGLSMLKTQLASFNGELKLRSLDLVSIENVRPEATGLHGDKPVAWRLRGGWQPATQECWSDCLQFKLEADKGYVWSPLSGLALSGYLGGAIQDNIQRQGNVEFRGTVSMVYEFPYGLRGLAEYRRSYLPDANGVSKEKEQYLLQARMALARNWDLRLGYEKSKVGQWSLNLGYYFY